MRHFIILILCISLLLSCKKKVAKNHSEFVGTWKHRISIEQIKTLSIGPSSSGYTDLTTNGVSNREDSKNWYIKNDQLIFGGALVKSETFSIDTYPTTANYQMTLDYDTVKIGQKYMKLNNTVYIYSE